MDGHTLFWRVSFACNYTSTSIILVIITMKRMIAISNEFLTESNDVDDDAVIPWAMTGSI